MALCASVEKCQDVVLVSMRSDKWFALRSEDMLEKRL